MLQKNEMMSVRAVGEKNVNEQELPGVLSSDSSATIIMKDDPPDGGLEAWLQVLGAFWMYFNTWGNSTNPICFRNVLRITILMLFVPKELSQVTAATRLGMRTRFSAPAAHSRCLRSVPYRASSWCSWASWPDQYLTRAISSF